MFTVIQKRQREEERREQTHCPSQPPHPSSSSRSGAQLGIFVLHHLPSPSSQNSSILSSVPIPPKITHASSSSVNSQTLNHQPSSLPPHRLCALNDKALDYTVQQQPFIPASHPSLILSILSFDAGSPSTTVTDLLFIQLSCPSSFLCSISYTLRMCAWACTCNSILVFILYVWCCLCFHMCLSSLQSLSKLHSAVTI